MPHLGIYFSATESGPVASFPCELSLNPKNNVLVFLVLRRLQRIFLLPSMSSLVCLKQVTGIFENKTKTKLIWELGQIKARPASFLVMFLNQQVLDAAARHEA